jgi:hypothetical protein
MANVFISYRRADSASISGRIYDRLVAKFGRTNVFKDVDDVPPGVNFGAYIHDSLQQCAVALVIIGPRWLDAQTADGGRRLDDSADWVRIEVETALTLGLTVLPLLVEGARVPKAAELPDSLRELAQINSVNVRNDPDFARDMDRVFAALDRAFASRLSSGVPLRAAPSQTPTTPTLSTVGPTSTGPISTPSPSAPQAPAAAPASIPVSVGVDTLPSRAKSHSKGRFWLLNSRPLVAGLAALLVVLASAALLSQVVGPALARNARATQTAVALATKAYAPTATFLAQPLFPYFAAAPGPQCDKGRATWSAYGNGASASVACSPDHTHLVGLSPSDARAVAMTTIGWDLPINLTTGTISVEVSHVSSNGGAHLHPVDLSQTSIGGYDFYLCSCGSYSVAQLTADSSWATFSNGNVNISSAHKIALAFQGATVKAFLDDQLVGSHTDANSQRVTTIYLQVDGENGRTPAPSADFANFTASLTA